MPQGWKKRKNIDAKEHVKSYKVLFLRLSNNHIQLVMVLSTVVFPLTPAGYACKEAVTCCPFRVWQPLRGSWRVQVERQHSWDRGAQDEGQERVVKEDPDRSFLKIAHSNPVRSVCSGAAKVSSFCRGWGQVTGKPAVQSLYSLSSLRRQGRAQDEGGDLQSGCCQVERHVWRSKGWVRLSLKAASSFKK